MTQSIAQSRAAYEAMHQRAQLATAELYAKTNRLPPLPAPRFKVIPSGNDQFGIVENATGTVRHVCTGHNAACRAARQLEAIPDAGPGLATLLLRWTVGFIVILLLFTAYGAHP